MKRFTILLLAVAFIVGVCTSAWADPKFPVRPIRLITLTPGSVMDISARKIADMLSAELGQPVLVVNHPGAGGNIAVNMMLAAPADGYTLCITGVDTFADNFFLLGQVDYKFEDLAPISFVNVSRSGVITQPDKPWTTLRDAFAEAKAKNLTLRAGFFNPRMRFIFEKLAEQEGVNLALVPQPGGPPTITAIMGGHLDLGFVGSLLVEYTKAGSVKTLATSGDVRMSHLPEVLTMQEQGFKVAPYDAFIVLFTKTGVPDPIIDRLSDIMKKISQDPEYKKVVIESVNAEPMTPGREYAAQRLRQAYNDIAREMGKPVLP